MTEEIWFYYKLICVSNSEVDLNSTQVQRNRRLASFKAILISGDFLRTHLALSV